MICSWGHGSGSSGVYGGVMCSDEVDQGYRRAELVQLVYVFMSQIYIY